MPFAETPLSAVWTRKALLCFSFTEKYSFFVVVIEPYFALRKMFLFKEIIVILNNYFIIYFVLFIVLLTSFVTIVKHIWHPFVMENKLQIQNPFLEAT